MSYYQLRHEWSEHPDDERLAEVLLRMLLDAERSRTEMQTDDSPNSKERAA